MSRDIEQAAYAAMQRENRRRSLSAVVTVFVVIPVAVLVLGAALLALDAMGVFG